MKYLLAAATACGLLWSGAAVAQDGPAAAEVSPDDEARARRISGQLMSPFCPGRTLNECPSPSAGEWRQDIRQWVAEGVEAPEIRRRLEARVPGTDLTLDDDDRPPFVRGRPPHLAAPGLGALYHSSSPISCAHAAFT